MRFGWSAAGKNRWKPSFKAVWFSAKRASDDLVLHPHVTLHAQDVVAGGAGYPELVMISCKGYQTVRTVANALPLIGPDTRVLTLQNGMGNAEIIAERVPVEHVFFGAASVAADSHELGHVVDTTNHNRIPLIGIAPLSRREDPFCDVLEKLFVSLGYTTSASVASEQFVWKKLCLNSCGNALRVQPAVQPYLLQRSGRIYSSEPDLCRVLRSGSGQRHSSGLQ